jgi:hypothetical protein
VINTTNQTVGFLNCTCSEAGGQNVRVVCNYVKPQCLPDNFTCYIGLITQLFNQQLQQVGSVESCTTYVSSLIPSIPTYTEVCIQVTPYSTGDFTSLLSCTALLRDTRSRRERTFCTSCNPCSPITDRSPNDLSYFIGTLLV